MNRSTLLAHQIHEKRGYLVMKFEKGPLSVPRVGDVVKEPSVGYPGEHVLGPFTVIGYTDAADYDEQRLLVPNPGPPGDRSNVLAYLKVVVE